MFTIANATTRNYGNGNSKFWDILKDGVRVAMLSKHAGAFAKYSLLSEKCSAEFRNQDEVLAFCAKTF